MESRAKILGHPVHPILIVFPLGLLATAVVFDIIFLVTNDVRLTQAAYFMIAAGVIVGLVAAVFGWIDWFAIPRRTRAKRIGLLHGLGNVVVVGLFALSWVLRRGQITAPPTEAVVAGIGGVLLALFTAWLGGELVDRLGVGVDDGAHLDAPSSLSGLPAGVGLGTATRRELSEAYRGTERRVFSQPAYAGVERRSRR